MMNNKVLDSSFRDPSGFVFIKNGCLYRQINKSYLNEFTTLKKSGLYNELIKEKLLIPHEIIKDAKNFKIIKPDFIDFISYPYEWSFSMLKDAALTTLKIQKTAMKYKMALKDASAYNIQFIDGKPILIDTLSFDKYEPGNPWIAYQQFCRHFLAPLSLMAYVNVELGKLLKIYIDGIPLNLTSKLLPAITRLSFGLLLHIHFHSKNQQKYASKKNGAKEIISKTGMLGLIDSLETTVQKLKWKPSQTEWGDYYLNTNYSAKAMTAKEQLVEKMILKTKPKIVWDLGANTGKFSRLATKNGIKTIAFDIDPLAVELNYLECQRTKEKNLLPLIQDLTNPSSNIGFANKERDSLVKRGPASTVLALALIHHLAISNNLPFTKIAEFFSLCGDLLIIEFVPKEDEQVKKLLRSRKDIFLNYSQINFKVDFSRYFDIQKKEVIPETKRALYLMKRKKDD